MIKKVLICLVAAALAFGIFAACAKPRDPAPTAAPVVSAAPTDAPTAAPTAEPTPAPTPEPSLKNELTCLEDTFVDSIMYAGDGYLAALCSVQASPQVSETDDAEHDETDDGEYDDFEEGESDPRRDFVLRLVNMFTDEVEAEYKGYGTHELFGIRSSGEIVIYSPGYVYNDDLGAPEIVILDRDLKVDRTEAASFHEAFMDPANDRIVYQNNNGEIRFRNFDGNDGLLLEDTQMKLDGVDPITGSLLLTRSNPLVYNDHYIWYLPNEERMLCSGSCSGWFDKCLLSGDSVLLLPWAYSEYDGKSIPLTVVDVKTGEERLRSAFSARSSIGLFASSSTPYALISEYLGEDQNHTENNFLLDSSDGLVCSLDDVLGDDRILVTAEYAEDIGRWIATTQEYVPDSDRVKSKIILIDPTAFACTDELPAWDETKPALEGFLLDARALADGIEEKYGVSIYLANELDEQPPGTYEFSSDYPELAMGALNDLDRNLARYPEGFFDEFKNIFGWGGVEFILFSNMDDRAGDANNDSDSRYTVRLAAGHVDYAIHHEIWHIVEFFITRKLDNAFPDEEWQTLNPVGSKPPDNYWQFSDYLLDLGCADPYFLRAYGLNNPMEDRADLIGYLLDGDVYGGIDELYAYPHLKAKYDYMAERTRTVFGSVYWEEMSGYSR
ncbi:MAG: hypothetical protein IKS90_02615 [Clostridia bacterium]|nr:hypothetical protein [Clostridia bacterium]